MNPYQDAFKNRSSVQLIILLKNPSEYNDQAIEAAKNELHMRSVSPDEYARADEIYQRKKDHAQNRKNFETKIQRKASLELRKFLALINPLTFKEKTNHQKTRLFILVLSGIALLFWKQHSSLLNYMLFDSRSSWDWQTFYIFLPTLSLTLGLVLMFLKNKWGVPLVVFFLAFQTVFSFYIFLDSLDRGYQPYASENSIDINDLFVQSSSQTLLVISCIWLIILVSLKAQNFKKELNYSSKFYRWCFFLGIAINTVLVYRFIVF